MRQHHALLPDLSATARCALCRLALGAADEALCERCGTPLHFSCHQRVAATPSERAQLQAAVDEMNACETIEVEVGDVVVRVRPYAVPGDDLYLILLCPGCRN